jgi:hypothetical protein
MAEVMGVMVVLMEAAQVAAVLVGTAVREEPEVDSIPLVHLVRAVVVVVVVAGERL